MPELGVLRPVARDRHVIDVEFGSTWGFTTPDVAVQPNLGAHNPK